MLSIGFCYDIYNRIGTKSQPHARGRLIKQEDTYLQETGFFHNMSFIFAVVFGLIMIIISAIISTVFGLIRDDRLHLAIMPEGQYLYMFFGLCIANNFVNIFVTITALARIMRLHYKPEVEFIFDEMLLLVSLAGCYFLAAIMATAAFFEMGKHHYYIFCIFYIADCVLTYMQTTLQYILIRNGVHRRSVLAAHFKDKPGRNMIAFLMLSNMAQWITMSFMFMAIKGSFLLIHFYGTTTWIVISNLALPLVIFHRFHAGACLAEIFESAYHLPKYKPL